MHLGNGSSKQLTINENKETGVPIQQPNDCLQVLTTGSDQRNISALPIRVAVVGFLMAPNQIYREGNGHNDHFLNYPKQDAGFPILKADDSSKCFASGSGQNSGAVPIRVAVVGSAMTPSVLRQQSVDGSQSCPTESDQNKKSPLSIRVATKGSPKKPSVLRQQSVDSSQSCPTESDQNKKSPLSIRVATKGSPKKPIPVQQPDDGSQCYPTVSNQNNKNSGALQKCVAVVGSHMVPSALAIRNTVGSSPKKSKVPIQMPVEASEVNQSGSDQNNMDLNSHETGVADADSPMESKSDVSGDSNSTIQACEKAVRSRSIISIEDKERLVNAYEDGEDVYNFGRLLGIKETTIRGIINRYTRTCQITTGQRGGDRRSIFTETIADSLLDFFDANYSATTKDARDFLQSNHSIAPAIGTINNFLKTRYISRKKPRYSSIGKNCDSVKSSRVEYVENYLRSGRRSSQCIYIDETSFNMWVHRRLRHTALGPQEDNTRGPNTSLILAVSKNGPVHFKVIVGAFDKNAYQEFITEVSKKLPLTQHYIMHDIPSIYFPTLSTSQLYKIVNLPPYSPFLNPMRTLFCQLKSKIRTKLSCSSNVSSMKPIEKCKLVENLMTEELLTRDFSDLSTHYNNIKTFFPDCLLSKDIL